MYFDKNYIIMFTTNLTFTFHLARLFFKNEYELNYCIEYYIDQKNRL